MKLLLLSASMILITGCVRKQDYGEQSDGTRETCTQERPCIAAPDEGNEPYLVNLDQSRDIWLSQGLENYSFKYYASSYDCPTEDPFPLVIISVLGNEVESVYVPQFDSYEDDIGRWPTIIKVFEAIEESLSSTTISPNMIEFDSELGFPSEYRIDYSDSDCDSLITKVTEFSSGD